MPNRFSSSCAGEASLSVSSVAERLSSQALYLFLGLSAFSALLSIKEKSCRKYDRIFLLATVDKNDTVSFGFKWFHSKMKP